MDDQWTDPTGADAIGRVLSEFVLAPTRWYLTHLDSLATGQPDLALRLADDVLSILRTGECIIRQSVPLEGLKLADDVAQGSSGSGCRRQRCLSHRLTSVFPAADPGWRLAAKQ